MLILSRSDVERALTMEMALAGCREAYVAVAEGQTVLPERHAVHVPERNGDMLVMSGYLPGGPSLGLKVVSVFPDNHRHDLENTLGAIILLDADTGRPDVLMDGTFLTALRTGAGSGVATDLLAQSNADSVAILGTGGMAWHQLESVCAVRPIRSVYVWNRTVERARTFAELVRHRRRDLTVVVTEKSEEAVRQALIICAATSSPDPVVRGAWLRPGAHVNVTGAHRPDWREVDGEVVRIASVRTVDSLSAALVPGDLRIPLEEGLITHGDIVSIGHIATGKHAGRRNDEAVTLFKSVGLAVQDLAVAVRVRNQAIKLALGIQAVL